MSERDFWEGYVPEPDKRQQALDKKAENARELGLDYEPAQQEPVAYGMWDTMLGKNNRMMMVRLDNGQDGCTVPLYTSPPAQRTWVSLTDEEIQTEWVLTPQNDRAEGIWFGRRIEAKLKEKNT